MAPGFPSASIIEPSYHLHRCGSPVTEWHLMSSALIHRGQPPLNFSVMLISYCLYEMECPPDSPRKHGWLVRCPALRDMPFSPKLLIPSSTVLYKFLPNHPKCISNVSQGLRVRGSRVLAKVLRTAVCSHIPKLSLPNFMSRPF